jgi:hypothetical protein
MRNKIYPLAATLTLTALTLGSLPARAEAPLEVAPAAYDDTPRGVVVGTQPVGYEYKPRYGLIASGLTLFGVSYLTTVIAAAAVGNRCVSNQDFALGCKTADWPIYIPVAGPFIQMGYLTGPGTGAGRALLAIDGVLQTSGVILAIVGAASGKRQPVYVSKNVQISPWAGQTGAGLFAVGRF